MKDRTLIVLVSYHHRNTEKIADVLARVLEAKVVRPEQIDFEQLRSTGLVGLGSGIYDGRHHRSLFDLVERLPHATGKRAFIFSTCGVPAIGMNEEYVRKNHSLLREKLQSKGYAILDEFSCLGLNTNSFLRVVGGINKGRPDAGDLKRAEEFAQNLKTLG
jgi:flavodoxin